MTLLLPAPPAFGYFVTNDDSPGSSTTYGTAVTASGSTHTKGSWTAIHSTISYDLFLHDIHFSSSGTTGDTLYKHFIDLGIGPDASNVTVIAENLVACMVKGMVSGGHVYASIPLFVPAGTQLWARTQSNVASQALRVAVDSWGAPDHPESFPKISYIEAVGENTGTTAGTSITAGASGALGTATSLGSFTNDVCAVFFSPGSDDTTLSAVGYCCAMTTDATATVQELGMCAVANGNTSEDWRTSSWPMWCDIPAGQVVAGRLSCSGTSDATMWGVGYGCVRG